jgi:hypothetical protein
MLLHGTRTSRRPHTIVPGVEKWACIELARVLLQHGIDAQDVDKWTSLHCTSRGGHVGLPRVLLL